MSHINLDTIMRNILIISFTFLSLFQSNLFASESLLRWYSAEQQKLGNTVFQKNCSVCHGNKAQATPNWKQTNANGQYPPPPLNGSAHAWHHSLDTLRRSVREGGQKIGGLMPSFEKTLSAYERDNAIAYFQSQWSDELYDKWSENFKVAPLQSIPSKSTISNPLLNSLKNRLNAPKIDSFKSIADEQLYEVKTQGQTIYLTKDGQFAVIGNLVDLKTGKKLTQ